MIDAFKAWAEQFAKRLDELGRLPGADNAPRCHGLVMDEPSPSWANQGRGDRR